jgi:hypothetical protein
MSRALEAGGIAGRRKDLLAGLTQVIDIGASTGPSFGHYLDNQLARHSYSAGKRLAMRRLTTAQSDHSP